MIRTTYSDTLVEGWLSNEPEWYRRGMYAGMAKAREAHALHQNRRLDSDSLKHMQIAKYYEGKAQ